MKKILVTGVSGLLGSNLLPTLSERFEIIGIYHGHQVYFENCEIISGDITHADETRAIIRQVEPDVVIHCAAETRVDYCKR